MNDEPPINWSDVMGTARVVHRGPLVVIGGLASLDDNGVVIHLGDAYAQTRRILERVGATLASIDVAVAAIVCTRVIIAAHAKWEDVARAHGEFFHDIRPVTTMAYGGLLNPAFLVEIDVTAWSE